MIINDRTQLSYGEKLLFSKSFSVAVMVSDAKASAKWYREKLGFNSSEEGHWVTVWPKGAQWKIHLCQGKLEPGNTGIAFYCDNLAKTVKQLKAKGVKFSQDVKKEDWGTYAMIEDPDGTSSG
jgi:catechol 2,3-dioxygenase-like lactoylglutathione lyase family enzyme